MIGTIDIAINAKSPNMPLFPMRAFVNSPSSIRIVNVPKRIGKWCIDSVQLIVVYPDGTTQNTSCILTGGVWTGTVEGTGISGRSENGYTVIADGTDENGNQVTGYVLGKGDVEILEADGALSPDPARYYVKLLSAETAEPREGDLYPTNSGYVIWQNGQANQLGTPFEQISTFVESELSAKVDLSALNEVENSLSNYYTKSETSSNAEISTALDLKQDKLSEPQINSINSNVDDNKTVVYYDNIQPRSYDIYGTMNIDDIRVEGSNITNVNIGRGVRTLGTELFMNSSLLTSIELPDSLKTIGVNSFTTSNIASLVIPDSVETINAYAFSSARTVSITVGSGVETIGNGAFDNCDNLTSLVFKGKTLEEVEEMANYPWGITNASIITTWNAASQEWVLEQLSALEARIAALEAIVGGTTITATHSETDDWGGDFDVQANISLSAYVGLNLTKAKLQPPNGTVTSEFSGSPATVTDWNENITIYADGIGGSQVIAWNKSTGWTNNNVTLMSNAVLYTTYHYPADATRSTLDITIEVKNT